MVAGRRGAEEFRRQLVGSVDLGAVTVHSCPILGWSGRALGTE